MVFERQEAVLHRDGVRWGGMGWDGVRRDDVPQHLQPLPFPHHPAPQGYFFPQGIFPAQGATEGARPGAGPPLCITPVQTQP